MTALTIPWPGNESRTSTHAIAVPATALNAATTSAAISVSFSADHASGRRTSCQNVVIPSARELQTSAASGTRTIRLRYPTAIPRARPPPAPPTVSRGRGTETEALVAKDLGHHADRVVEEPVLDGLPAAHPELRRVDREERLRLLELGAVLRAPRDGLQHRP